MRRGETGDGLLRERRQPKPVDARAGRDLSEHDPQRVPAIEPDVPVGRDHERREAVHAPREQPQDVERRLIRRVKILEHQNRRRALLEQTPNRGGDLVGNGFPLHGVRQVAARGLRNVEQRPERAGCEQHVAGAPQHASGTLDLLAEPFDQRRLADPGLAGDECHPAAAGLNHRRENFRQRRELLRTLQQPVLLHDRTRLASDVSTVTATPSGGIAACRSASLGSRRARSR